MNTPRGIPPAVCQLFEKLTLGLYQDGWEVYSADAILHRIRWHYHVDQGDHAFKANNDWTPDLARWMMALHPEIGPFFRTRAIAERLENGAAATA